MGFDVISDIAEPFKLKVYLNYNEKDRNTHISIASIFQKLKFLSFGIKPSNRGYEGEEVKTNISPSFATSRDPLKIRIKINKLRNLIGLYVIDVKRIRGDIWQFKQFYQSLVERLDLGYK